MNSLRSVANAKLFRTSYAVHEQSNIFAFSFRVGINEFTLITKFVCQASNSAFPEGIKSDPAIVLGVF